MKVEESSPETATAADSSSGHAADAVKRKSFLNRWYARPLISGTAVIAFLGLWQYVGTSGMVNPLFTGYPTGIVSEGIRWFIAGNGWHDLRVTIYELGVGFGMAILLGIPLGILMGWYRPLNWSLQPFVDVLYVTPRIALLPLIIIWFGIGSDSKILLVFLSALFPLLISTYAGVRTTDNSLLQVARSFEASDFQVFRTIVVPGCVPAIFTGLRLGLGRALVGVVVGQMFAANAGVGYTIRVAGNTFQTNLLLAGVALMAVAGIVGTIVIEKLGSYFDKWRPDYKG